MAYKDLQDFIRQLGEAGRFITLPLVITKDPDLNIQKIEEVGRIWH